MATDTLEIFGTEYTGVTGVKATDSNNQTKTYIRPQGTVSITSSGTTDVTAYASVSVPTAVPFVDTRGQEFYTDPDDGKRKFRYRAMVSVDESEGDTAGYLADGVTIYSDWYDHYAIPSGTVITPTKSTQTLGDGADVLEDAVTINPIPSQYIIPSGTLICDDSGDWNVTEAATFRVQAGTAGTPTATKGSVSNHSVSVTPSATNTTGWIDGSTKTGTAVTVTASELVSGSETKTANGTYDVTNLAQLIVNVAGGGSGLVYETGTYTPSTDITRPQILWTNTHTEAPVLIYMCDVTGTAHSTTNSNYVFAYCDQFKLWGQGYPYTSTVFRYANAFYVYRGSSASSVSNGGTQIAYNSDSTSSGSTSYPRYWASPTDFHPYSNSTSRYWRAGRTYKWIAVWKPTT